MGAPPRVAISGFALAGAVLLAARGLSPSGFAQAPVGGSSTLGALRGGRTLEPQGDVESASGGIATSAGAVCGLVAVAALLSVRRRASAAPATARRATLTTTGPVELTKEQTEMAEMLSGLKPMKDTAKMSPLMKAAMSNLNGNREGISRPVPDDEDIDVAAITKEFEGLKDKRGRSLDQYIMGARLKLRHDALHAPISPDAPLVGKDRGWSFGLPWAKSIGGAAEPGSELYAQKLIGFDVETRKLGLGPDEGETYWDPLGFAKLYDRNFDFNNVMTYPHVQWLREAEIKHGRICMLAFVGFVFQALGARIPGYPVSNDLWTALDTCYADRTAQLGMVQIWIFITFCEGLNYPRNMWIGKGNREPGDFGWDPLKLGKTRDMETAKLKELKNGRLAMVGVASIGIAHAIPGSVPLWGNLFNAHREGGLCGETPANFYPPAPAGKTAAKYSTATIFPSLVWSKTGIKSGDLAPRQLKAVEITGVDCLVGKTEGGKIFVVQNNCPHIGTPLSTGADVIGNTVICPLHGSAFDVFSGEVIEWSTQPPIIGPLTGMLVEQAPIVVFQVRENLFNKGEIEVLVDQNARKAYEAPYWKGILDAQGKNDGTYY